MQRIHIIALGLALVFAVVTGAPRAAHAELKVVATVPDLAALAKEVGGDEVKVTSLSLPTQDPHWVDAKPSLMLPLNKADMLIAIGLDLEVGWLPVLQTGARNKDIVTGGRGYLECAGAVELLDVPTRKIDRSEGDIHPGGNPHYLYDPRAAIRCARWIAAKMIELDPKHARSYAENLQSFVDRVEEKRADWEKRMAKYAGTPVITYHRSWIYLTEWLGLEVVEHLEPKPGIQPSPRHVARVIKLGRAKNVEVLLQESYYPSKTAHLVAKKIGGARLVELPGGADLERGEGYVERMERMISALEEALGD